MTRVPPAGCDFVITEAVRVKDWQTKSGGPVEGRIKNFERHGDVDGAFVTRTTSPGGGFRWFPLTSLETIVEEHECDCECGAHG